MGMRETTYSAAGSSQSLAEATPRFNPNRIASLWGRAVASSASAALSAWLLPLLLWGCSSAETNAAMCCAGSALALALGAAEQFFPLQKRRIRAAAVVVAVAFCALVLAVPALREVAFSLVNAVIFAYDDAFGAYAPLLASGAVGASSVPLGLCMGAAFGIFAWFLSRSRLSGISLLLVAIFGAASLRMGLGYGGVAITVGMASWLISLRLAQLNAAMFSPLAFARTVFAVLSLCSAAYAACLILYTPSSSVDAAKNSIERAIDNVRYGSDSLPEGDLSAAFSMNDGEDDCLELTFERVPKSELLLRGFVGASFEGSSWVPLGHEAYEGEWRGMSSWLYDQGFVPAFQRAAFDDAGRTAQLSSVDSIEVRVRNHQADARYLYVPYTLRSMSRTARLDLDGALVNEGMGVRSYNMTIDDVSDAEILADASFLEGSASSYASAEGVFSAFASEHYLEVPEEEREALFELVFNPETWDGSSRQSDYAIISRVRTMLETLASTTSSVSQPVEGESFCRWFLGSEHKGNSAYFATAATLAFRSQGIPARYVEGYRVGQSELSAAVGNGGEVSVGARQAHAWCEIYLSGLGWTPVEVTPGFYKQVLQADSVIDVGEAYSNGSEDAASGAESVAGAYESSPDQAENRKAMPAYAVVAIVVALFAAAALCTMLAAFAQRACRRRLRVSRAKSDDQSVCVVALYRELSLIMGEGCKNFDARRPLECVSCFEQAFTGIDSLEYRRVIELHQAYAFGMRELKPHELRVLRRFNGRLHASLARPEGLIGAARRYFVKAL